MSFLVYEYVRKEDRFFEVGFSDDLGKLFKMMGWPGPPDPDVAAAVHITDFHFARLGGGVVVYNSDVLSLLAEIKLKESKDEA